MTCCRVAIDSGERPHAEQPGTIRRGGHCRSAGDRDVVRPEARDIARRIADPCQFDPQDIPTLQDLTKQLNGAQVLTDPTAGPFGQRLKENAPDAPIGVPLLIGQGLADVVVYPRGQSGRSRRRPHVRFSRSGPARMGVK